MIRRAAIARVALLARGLLGAVTVVAPHAQAADLPSSAQRHRTEFPLDGIVGLTGDRFLLWHGTGEMQVRTATGEWTPVFRTATRPVADVIPDTQGFIATGSLDRGLSGIVLLDVTGHELARWTLGDQVFRVLSGERGRFATTRAGLVSLRAGGAVDPIVPYLEPATPFHTVPPGPLAAPPEVLRAEMGQMIACRARDLSMAHHAPGRCWKSGTNGWKILGDFARAIVCGDWLAVVEGSLATRVGIYSLASGTPELKIATPSDPQIACTAPGQLLVGDRRLRLFRLPRRKPIWTSEPMRAPILHLAATESALAYRVDNSLDVVVMPRPFPR